MKGKDSDKSENDISEETEEGAHCFTKGERAGKAGGQPGHLGQRTWNANLSLMGMEKLLEVLAA